MKLAETKDCCGYSACAQKCPKGCISMKPSEKDGFLYPVVNSAECIDCGLCTKSCPVFIESESTKAQRAYAFQTKDEKILKDSSSGGLFTSLACKIINEGGVVFGARFKPDWQVEISYTDCIEGLARFRGSKYVQASVGNSFREAKAFLDQKCPVLFTGTSCQIAGLKSYLGKDYENLLTIDLICHGTPSPLVWSKYLSEHQEVISSVCFRDKASGWKNYKVRINSDSTPFYQNDYMGAFLGNLDLRLSCSSCSFKEGRSGSDITIGDFWGIEKISPEKDNDLGLCCVIMNTVKAERICSELKLIDVCPIEEIPKYNPSYTHPSPHHVNRDYFFSKLKKHSFSKAYADTKSTSIVRKIERKLYRLKKI